MIRSNMNVNMAAERVYAWYWRRDGLTLSYPENP